VKKNHKIITSLIILIIISFLLRKCGNSHDGTDSIPVDIIQVDTTHVDSSAMYVLPPDSLKLGKTTLTVGNKPSVHGEVLIVGNKDFYNTKTHRPFSFHPHGPKSNDITEPDWFIQLQYEFQKDTYIGFHLNKEKFRGNRDRFGFGGPTDLGISIGKSYRLFNVKWLSANMSLASGITIGHPRFETPWWFHEYGTEHIYSDRLSISGYERIGMFTTFVTRFDITIMKRVNLFVAPTFTSRYINDYSTNIGTQKTGGIYSIGLNVGVGLNFNYKKKLKPQSFITTINN